MIYLLRHGRTQWNEDGKIQGRTDTALSAGGIRDVLKLRPVFENHCFEHVYVSPLKRAEQTRQLLLSKSHVKALSVEEGLSEYDFENNEDVQKYLERIIEVLVRASRESGNVLFITHGNVIADLLRAVDPSFNGLIDNLSISAIENTLDGNGIALKPVGYNLDELTVRELLRQNDFKQR